MPASLSVSGDTVTLTLKPSGTVTYSVMVALPVAALSDKTSGERDPFEYGLSDLNSITFSGENPKITENIARLKNPGAPLQHSTARLVIPWDTQLSESESAKAVKWVEGVEKDGLEPYITVEAEKHEKHTLGISEYRKAMKRLMKKSSKWSYAVGGLDEPVLYTK